MRLILVAAMFALVGVAYSEDQPQPKPIEAKKAPQSEERGTDKSSLSIKILPAQDTENKAAKEDEYRKEGAEEGKRTTNATVWLAFVTTALAVFTAGLWWATRKLVINAEDTSKKEIRAYVRIQAIEVLDFSPKTRVRINYKLTNVGHSPAHKVRAYSGISVLPYPLPPDVEMTTVENKSTSEGVLFVDDDYVCKGLSVDPLTENEIEQIKSGDKFRLYICSYVTYLDIFDVPHATEYVACIGGPSFVPALTESNRIGRSDIRFEYAPHGNKIT